MDQPVQLNAFVWESRPGHLSLTIACAISFRLQHGAEAQIVEPLRFYDDEQATAFDANMRAPFKARGDLVVYGHACVAANAPEVDALVVRIRYAEFTKGVRVVGDRVWMRDGTRVVASAPMRFRRLQLAHERAARSAENPRGFDPDAPPAERRAAMPNLERASQMQSALLGAVPADAPQRANQLRTGPTSHAAAAFVRAVLAGQRPPPPPDGFPFQYFNVAPLDQQLEHIPFGAAIVLENMHAEHALFSSRLPALVPRGFVFDPRTQGHAEVELRCDTLWIDADRSTATIVCRGVVATPYADAASHASVRVDTFVREERSNAMFETRLGALDRGSGLPFGRAAADPGQKSPTFGPAPTAGRAADDEGGMTTRMDRLTIGQQKVGPPPRQEPATPRPATDPPPARERKAFITQEIELAGPVAATPFEAAKDAKDDDDPKTRTLAMATQLLPAERHTATAPRAFDDVESESSTDTPTPPPRLAGAVPKAVARSAPPPPAEARAPATPAIRTKRLKPPDIPRTPPPPLPRKPTSIKDEPSPRPPAVAAKAEAPSTIAARPEPAAAPSAPSAPKRPEPPPRVSLPSEASARLGALKLGNAQLKGAGLMLANAAAAIHGEPRISAAAPRETTAAAAAASERPTKSSSTEGTAASAHVLVDAPSTGILVAEERTTAGIAPASPTIRDENTDTNAGVAIRGVEARTLEEAEAEGERDAFEFPLPRSDGHEVEGVTLEHCAAIRAAMAMSASDRATVLAKNDLDDATWARIEKAHMARIDQETSKGVMDLLSRYDAAYVAAQDKLRRPIGVKEYARILVAREKGDLAEAMGDLGVPRSELMRLDRVWKQRRAAYPDVDKAIAAAVATQKTGR